jgi:transcriptional antiterminator NusG
MGGEACPNLGLGEHITMYYVVQVAPREEKNVEALVRELLPSDVCQRCFHMKRHVLKKYHGEWHDVHEKLLPGYVFIETDDIGAIHEALRKIDRFTSLLGQESETVLPLTDKEVMWLECLLKYCDDCNYEIPLSKIIICDGVVTFVSGPLKDIKHLIKKFNTHKRIAEVSLELCGKVLSLYVGIEFA